MLGERIAKLHAQVGRGVMGARSRRALAAAAGEFERALREVSAGAGSPEIRDNYRLLRHLWDEYRAAALRPATPESARSLAERNEEVVWIAEKGARLLHAQHRSASTERVMAAGAARAAAQRIAKLHMQRGWALPAGASSRELRDADAQLPRDLAQLKDASAPEEIDFELRVAESQLGLMRQAVERLARGDERALQLEHIAKTADHIAETMDRVAAFYAKIGD